tara:strand:- start:257 stop:787 length:531 start_codon:yes stop_codon:yes gene_type:complete
MKTLFTLTLFIFSNIVLSCEDLLNTDVKVLNKKEYKNLCEYDQKTILVVNTASKCGFTYQYEQLEELYRRFRDDDFVILAFPSRNFLNQEFRSEQEVEEFCKSTFDVSFPMFSIADVGNRTKNPFYKKLFNLTDDRPQWNFHKFLITKDGEIKSFSHKIDPLDKRVVGAIQDSINS